MDGPWYQVVLELPSERRKRGSNWRTSQGKFAGDRHDLQSFPRLPIFPAKWTLEDPRDVPYLVFWTRSGVISHGLRMERDPVGVRVTFPAGASRPIHIVNETLGCGRKRLVYLCPGCDRRCRFLFLRNIVSTWPACDRCSGLTYALQGLYICRELRPLYEFEREWRRDKLSPPRPTYLHLPMWDPRAVSSPLLLAEEFPGLLVPRVPSR